MLLAHQGGWDEILLIAGPIIVIYMLGQRFMVAGLTAGSVKG